MKSYLRLIRHNLFMTKYTLQMQCTRDQTWNFHNTFDRACDQIKMEIHTENFFRSLISMRLCKFVHNHIRTSVHNHSHRLRHLTCFYQWEILNTNVVIFTTRLTIKYWQWASTCLCLFNLLMSHDTVQCRKLNNIAGVLLLISLKFGSPRYFWLSFLNELSVVHQCTQSWTCLPFYSTIFFYSRLFSVLECTGVYVLFEIQSNCY